MLDNVGVLPYIAAVVVRWHKGGSRPSGRELICGFKRIDSADGVGRLHLAELCQMWWWGLTSS